MDEKSMIMMMNLPGGTMRSDVEEILKGWIPTIVVVSVDLVPSIILKRKTLTAYITLPSKTICNDAIAFYDAHFANAEGFAYQNNFGRYGMVKAQHCHANNRKYKNSGEESWVFSDDEESLRKGPLSLHNPHHQRKSHPKKYVVHKTLILHEVPRGTYEEEVRNILLGWNPALRILNIDITPQKINPDKHNAYVALSTQEECDFVVNHFNCNFMPNLFWYVNKVGIGGKIKVQHYQGKRKIVANETLQEKSNKAGWGAGFVKSKKTELHNTTLDHKKESSVLLEHNIEGRGNTEHSFRDKSDSKSGENDFTSINVEKLNPVDIYSSKVLIAAAVGKAESLKGPEESSEGYSEHLKDQISSGKSSEDEDDEDDDGIFIADTEVETINVMCQEKLVWSKTKKKTQRYNQVLEDTLQEKCSEFFLSETELVALQCELEILLAKVEQTSKLRDEGVAELEQLKEQFENFQLLD